MSFDLGSRLICFLNTIFPFPQSITFLFFLSPFLLLIYTGLFLFPDFAQRRKFEFFLVLVISLCGPGYMMSATRQFLSTLLFFLFLFKSSSIRYLFLSASLALHLTSFVYISLAAFITLFNSKLSIKKSVLFLVLIVPFLLLAYLNRDHFSFVLSLLYGSISNYSLFSILQLTIVLLLLSVCFGRMTPLEKFFCVSLIPFTPLPLLGRFALLPYLLISYRLAQVFSSTYRFTRPSLILFPLVITLFAFSKLLYGFLSDTDEYRSFLGDDYSGQMFSNAYDCYIYPPNQQPSFCPSKLK